MTARQSFSAASLRAIGRTARDPDVIRSAYSELRRAGNRNIGLDIMYALPGQRIDDFACDLQTVSELAPEHLSAYSLTLEEGTALASEKGLRMPSDEESAEEWELLGSFDPVRYPRYEISNYAASPHECRHNQSVWHGEPYLGLGPAASSFDGTRRWTEVPDLRRWLAGEPPEFDDIPHESRLREIFVMGLRTVRGWEKLLERVRNGATLYLSLNDTILSGIDDVFGAGVRDRRMTNDTPEFRFDAGFSFTLPRRIRYRMNSYGAEVLGREADGNPAFFRHRFGKGMVYLLNFPLEAAAANTIGGFETDAWKLYREILHPRRLAESPSPFLQLTEHHFADGRTALIAVNNQPEPFKGALVLPAGQRLLDQRSDSNATWRAGTLEMPPNSGLLLLLG